MRLALIAGLLAALISLSGCATDGNGQKPVKPEQKPAKTGGGSTHSAMEPGKGEGFTTSERAKMEVAWEAFKDESPTWPALRDEWIAIGPKATNTLVENLLRAMILSRLANFPHGAQLARKELILIGSPAIPTLTGMLERPVWFNEQSGQEERLPSEMQTELNELLMTTGPDAVPALVKLSASEIPTVRRNAMNSLGQMKAPEGLPVLTDRLSRADHWIDRVTAARALGFGDDPRGEQALVRALNDRDEAVVIEAARSLARRGAEGAIPALERRRKTAKSKDEYKISRAMGEAVGIIRSRKQ